MGCLSPQGFTRQNDEKRGLAVTGPFTGDEVEVRGPSATLFVWARSAELTNELKDQKMRSWSDTTMEAVVAEIAADHGLALRMPHCLPLSTCPT